jgi:16S rRNA (uracil1498-N3)-methyltransferase
MKPPRVFAPDAGDGVTHVVLAKDEAHHLSRVLRLREGAHVRVFNGAGQEWSAMVASVTRHGAELDITGPVSAAVEPAVHVTLGIGILKGEQMDVVVRDATALGVRAIALFTSAHVTVPSRAVSSGAAADRWRRVAIASAKQCGRAVVPAIAPVAPFAEILGSTSANLVVMCVEPGFANTRAVDLPPDRPASVLALIGPEGGWAADEVEAALSAGARLVHLGPRTLRAEIAPTVLLSSLWTRWGW